MIKNVIFNLTIKPCNNSHTEFDRLPFITTYNTKMYTSIDRINIF